MIQTLINSLNPGDIILIILAILVVVFFAAKFLLRTRGASGAVDRLRESNFQAEEIMMKARVQAARVIEEANKKAVQILSDTKTFAEGADAEFKRALHEFSASEIRRFSESSEEIVRVHRIASEDTKKSFSKVSTELFDFLSNSFREGTRQFIGTLTEEMKKQESMISKNIDEWNAVAKRQIDDYKKEMIARINNSIYDIIAFVSKEVLGKSLNIEDHEDLIIRALEEAKKEGFFEK